MSFNFVKTVKIKIQNLPTWQRSYLTDVSAAIAGCHCGIRMGLWDNMACTYMCMF